MGHGVYLVGGTDCILCDREHECLHVFKVRQPYDRPGSTPFASPIDLVHRKLGVARFQEQELEKRFEETLATPNVERG